MARPRQVARFRLAALAGAVAGIAFSGCATVGAANARASALAAHFQEQPMPRSCDALWADALRVAQKRGFGVSSKDRTLLGETQEGVVAQVVSAATQTYRKADGGLVATTDWNRESGTRLRITGTPAGKDACKVRYDVLGGGVATTEEYELGPDWSYDLDLLQVLDPAAAAAVEAKVPAPR